MSGMFAKRGGRLLAGMCNPNIPPHTGIPPFLGFTPAPYPTGTCFIMNARGLGRRLMLHAFAHAARPASALIVRHARSSNLPRFRLPPGRSSNTEFGHAVLDETQSPNSRRWAFLITAPTSAHTVASDLIRQIRQQGIGPCNLPRRSQPPRNSLHALHAWWQVSMASHIQTAFSTSSSRPPDARPHQNA
ncbi:hypothetical protein BD413DRAFT_92907 [Trametes elegans]|nr:hypothetical protein BD413DRAFT_92907 [Trametes elegans]